MTGRLNTCQKILQEKNISAFLVSDFYNVGYLSGFFPLSPQEREVFLLITLTQSFLITDGRYLEAAKKLKTGFQPLLASPSKNVFQIVAELVRKFKIRRLAFEEASLTYTEYKKLKKWTTSDARASQLVPTKDLVENLRAQKEPQEIEAIKKACQIGDQAFNHLLNFLKPGLTEKEVADEIEWFIRKRGAVDLSFDPIVASGPNSAFPHHRTNDQRLKTKDIILLDFGAKVDGYCSDMTRVVFLGKATEEQKKVYQTVLEAQKLAIEHLGKFTSDGGRLSLQSHDSSEVEISGIKASDVDKIARTYITSQGYPAIPHGLGHGVGLCEHEAPHLAPKSRDILKPWMVFSVEPGIYLPRRVDGFGVRIEDLVLLTKSGPKILTHSPKEIIEI